MQGEDAFNDQDRCRRNRLRTIGNASVRGEVVDRALDVASIRERFHVLNQQRVLERVRMIEVLQTALFLRKMAEATIVEVQRQQRSGELRGQLAGKRRLSGTGAAGQSKDERALRKQQLQRGLVLQESDSFPLRRFRCASGSGIRIHCGLEATCGMRAVSRPVNCPAIRRPVSITSS